MNAPQDDKTTLPDPQADALLEAQRKAHAGQPRQVKDDAITDKVVRIEPDGTGPTPTDSMDPPADRAAGSGNPTPPGGQAKPGSPSQ